MSEVAEASLAEAFDKVAQNYDTLFKSKSSLAEDLALFGFVRDEGYATGCTVELGCGTGLFLEHVYKHPSDYVGVDVSSGMLAKASLKFPNHRFVHADMSRTPLPDAFADTVVCVFGAFSHLEDPEAALREVRRLLKPGGKFFVMVLGYQRKTAPNPIEDDIKSEIPTWYYTKEKWEAIVATVLGNVLVRGFGGYIAPYQKCLPQQALARVLRWRLAGTWKDDPDRCFHLIATGVR